MLNKLKDIANTYLSAREQILTEEATKTALIMPFFAALGFNVFNPLEVVPEITADIGEKKREKIDYALKSGDEYLMLVECKKCTVPLIDKNLSQLFRYFGALRLKLNVRLAILTNGIEYNFYSDLENDNVLDQIPFLSFDILNIDEQKANELLQFTKTNFNVETIITAAGEFKRRAAIEKLLESYMTNPSEAFVRCVLKDVASVKNTQQVISTYAPIIKDAFNQLIRTRVSNILKQAMNQNVINSEVEIEKANSEIQQNEVNNSTSVSTEEIEAFTIVKSIIRSEIDISRITFKDFKASCSIVLDDNFRKPLIKLCFDDSSKKRIILYNDKQNIKENQFLIDNVFEIYNYSEAIISTLKEYTKISLKRPISPRRSKDSLREEEAKNKEEPKNEIV
ncbi:MAG: type I restriction enzyme HsdR N-terminal domain-containing protein [Deltaproteobacteria bacterium]|nr:type I restriction enzyme HsdR N-terminal domain-containing protein [Deltaproteobacteria bacterium]